MTRLPELIGATIGVVPGTAMAWSMSSGANAIRSLVLNQLHNITTSAWAQRSQDFGTRHLPFTPFNDHEGERTLLKLSASIPEQVQSLAMYLGIALNLLSAYEYMRSNRKSMTSNVPVLNHLRPFAEIASSLSLAITPQILLMMIEQYRFLQTATHIGTTEAVMAFIPALLMFPAILKLPSIAGGAGHLINDVVIRPIAGAVRGIQNTKRRGERQKVLDQEHAESKKVKRNARLNPYLSSALEKREARQAADDIRNVLGEPVYTVDQRIADIDRLPITNGNPTKVVLGTIRPSRNDKIKTQKIRAVPPFFVHR